MKRHGYSFDADSVYTQINADATRHGYKAWGYEAEAKPKLWLDHEAEAEAEAEALPFLNHEAEAESEAQVFDSY